MIDKLWIKFFCLFFIVFTFYFATSIGFLRLELSQAQLRCGNEQFHTYLWTKFRLI